MPHARHRPPPGRTVPRADRPTAPVRASMVDWCDVPAGHLRQRARAPAKSAAPSQLGLEWCEPPEWRALLFRPCYLRAENTLRFEPLPQQQLDLLLEAVSAVKILKRGLVMPLVGLEPFVPERFERLELGLGLATAFG